MKIQKPITRSKVRTAVNNYVTVKSLWPLMATPLFVTDCKCCKGYNVHRISRNPNWLHLFLRTFWIHAICIIDKCCKLFDLYWWTINKLLINNIPSAVELNVDPLRRPYTNTISPDPIWFAISLLPVGRDRRNFRYCEHFSWVWSDRDRSCTTHKSEPDMIANDRCQSEQGRTSRLVYVG